MKPMYSDKIGAVIPAAGQGKRMGRKSNKLFLELAGTPIIAFTLEIFEKAERIAEIIIAAEEQEIAIIEELVIQYGISKAKVVKGGKERQQSVCKAVMALDEKIDRVVVHDGARPLFTLSELNQFLSASDDYESAITAVKAIDTIKIISPEGWIISTPERNNLRSVQTPQIFPRKLLEKVHKLAQSKNFIGTDDASLFEWQGYPVKVLEGSPANIKITTPEDLFVAERILMGRMEGGFNESRNRV